MRQASPHQSRRNRWNRQHRQLLFALPPPPPHLQNRAIRKSWQTSHQRTFIGRHAIRLRRWLLVASKRRHCRWRRTPGGFFTCQILQRSCLVSIFDGGGSRGFVVGVLNPARHACRDNSTTIWSQKRFKTIFQLNWTSGLQLARCGPWRPCGHGGPMGPWNRPQGMAVAQGEHPSRLRRG